LTGRQTEWERRELAAADERKQREHALQCLRRRQAYEEEQRKTLHDETERLAFLLLEDGEPAPAPLGRAA
jgi:hypothetical protein